MEQCPFLSTYDSEVECFKECALYNYKGSGGKCPFLTLYNLKKTEYSEACELYNLESELKPIIDSYFERKNQYL